MAVSMAVTRAFQFLSMIVLARLLTKEEFGLVIVAMMVIQILQAFSQMGLQEAFIQRKKTTSGDEKSAANTLLALKTAANTLFFIVAMLAVGQIAALLPKVEGVEPVLRWLLTMLLLDSVAGTAESQLRKRLEFVKVSQCQMVYAFTYMTIAVLLAFLGYGVWSMVAGHIAARLMQTISLLIASGWKPSYQFRINIARDLISSGLYLWGFTISSTVGSLLDRAFTARMLGSASMGIYGISYNLCTLPTRQIAFMVNGISFPAMAKMQGEPARLQKSFMKALSHVSLIAIPTSTGLFLVADYLIPVVYGVKWEDAVPVVRILAFYGMVLAIASVTNPILKAMGKAKLLLYTSIFHYSLLFVSLWFVASRGIEYVAWAVLLTITISSIVAFMLVVQQVRLTVLQILNPLCRTAVAAIFMTVTVELIKHTVNGSVSNLKMLMIIVPLGAVSFVLASLVVNRAISMDVIHTLKAVVSSRAA